MEVFLERFRLAQVAGRNRSSRKSLFDVLAGAFRFTVGRFEVSNGGVLEVFSTCWRAHSALQLAVSRSRMEVFGVFPGLVFHENHAFFGFTIENAQFA